MKHYTPGRMGMADGIGITFMSTFVTVFTANPALTVDTSAGLAWLNTLVHGTSSLAMLLVMIYICKHVPGDLFAVSEYLIGRWGARLIMVYFSIAFFTDYILVIRQFAENTLLTALPFAEFTVVIASYAVVAGILVYIGIEGMTRTSYLLMPFIIIPLMVVLLLLMPYYNIYLLSPWQGMGVGHCIWEGVTSAGMNFGIMALVIIAPSFQNIRTMVAGAIFGVGLSTLMRSFSVLVYTLVFGVSEGSEKVLPFFEMARNVYISRYVQRIESLFIVLWVINGAVTLAVDLFFGLYCLTRLGNMPAIRPLIPFASFALAELAMVPPDVYSAIQLFFQANKTLFNIGTYIVPLVLFVSLVIKRKGKLMKPWAED